MVIIIVIVMMMGTGSVMAMVVDYQDDEHLLPQAGGPDETSRQECGHQNN